ncbi:MAG TPA: hypothetical protein VHF90_02195 [Thermoleophilaceae bacterium]|nr:hypothetical protein [Thermoleophilaceae bacterium]
MKGRNAPRARRTELAAEEPLLGSDRYHYADAFEIRVDEPDERPAEQLVRSSLEQAARPVGSAIWIVHRHVVRFDLGPAGSPGHVLGWRVVESEHDAIHLEADSPLLRAAIVVRRTEPTRAVLATYLFYKRPVAMRALWRLVGPLHRRIAPYLLQQGARRSEAALSAGSPGS